MSYIIGLTGGIGSGKSAAARVFQELGAAVVDTDAIAHELTAAGGAAMAALRDAFGSEIVAPDGALDRAAMRARVFADVEARQRLEAILHPMIRDEVDARIAGTDAPYVVLVVPLLVETGFGRRRLNRVAVVDCSEETQAARTMSRSALSADQVRAIMSAQATRDQRLAVADDIIANEGDFSALQAEVKMLHERYLVESSKAALL